MILGSLLTYGSIERMFFKQDLVLNGEWNEKNRPPHRMVNLHRHPGKIARCFQGNTRFNNALF